MTGSPEYRPAVRVLLLDEDDRTLLLRYRNPAGQTFWVPPGGGLEAGEDHEAAARRELDEELGLAAVRLEPLGWRRRIAFRWGDNHFDQDEEWFTARCRAGDVDGSRLDRLRAEGADEVRWWSAAEIAAERVATFAPARLPELLPRVVRGDVDGAPVDVGP